MHESLCICALIPRLDLRTRVLLVQHPKEQGKTTNSGWLLHAALAHSELCFFRGRDQAPEPPLRLDPAREHVLLYPREGSEPVSLSRLARRGDKEKPLTLVVPDGTWAQSRKIAKHVPALVDLPHTVLPEEGVAQVALRLDVEPGRVMTLEAVARALELLEGEDPVRPLRSIYRLLIGRVMATRGTPLPGGPTMSDLVALGWPYGSNSSPPWG